ncbi:MAG: UDP-N-acetylglucosamine 2-epimerase [Rhodoluna sp.]|nr:UDP-N-acetylglucosamine 2-epimerase [Rhodoluna sp.]
MSRKVAVMTGTRADFGLLRPLLAELDSRGDVTLQLIATGTHLSEAHGRTVGEITAAGFSVAAEVSIWSEDDSSLGASIDTGNAVAEFSKTLASLQPDVVVVLGDRLEAFAMATAAVVLQIPVAHIHGGELTLGAMDDSLRHAITKLSYLHFATTDEHAARIIRMGEEPSRVYNFGAPVLDTLSGMHFTTKEELEAKFGVAFGARTALMTFHPAAFDEAPALEMFEELLAAIEAMHECHFIFTGTNNDIGSDRVRERMAAFVAANADRISFVESFGQQGYLSAMHQVDLVVGNSSSTVLEAPLLGTPSVLVGNRQEGRPQAASVIKAHADRSELLQSMRKAIGAEFAAEFEGQGTPFGQAGFAKKAAEVLASVTFATPLKKKFWEGQ